MRKRTEHWGRAAAGHHGPGGGGGGGGAGGRGEREGGEGGKGKGVVGRRVVVLAAGKVEMGWGAWWREGDGGIRGGWRWWDKG